MAIEECQRSNTWRPLAAGLVAARPSAPRQSGRAVLGALGGVVIELSVRLPRVSTQLRRSSARWGYSTAMSGTVGCTSQLTAWSSVIRYFFHIPPPEGEARR